jgi:hypothetical protein
MSRGRRSEAENNNNAHPQWYSTRGRGYSDSEEEEEEEREDKRTRTSRDERAPTMSELAVWQFIRGLAYAPLSDNIDDTKLRLHDIDVFCMSNKRVHEYCNSADGRELREYLLAKETQYMYREQPRDDIDLQSDPMAAMYLDGKQRGMVIPDNVKERIFHKHKLLTLMKKYNPAINHTSYFFAEVPDQHITIGDGIIALMKDIETKSEKNGAKYTPLYVLHVSSMDAILDAFIYDLNLDIENKDQLVGYSEDTTPVPIFGAQKMEFFVTSLRLCGCEKRFRSIQQPVDIWKWSYNRDSVHHAASKARPGYTVLTGVTREEVLAQWIKQAEYKYRSFSEKAKTATEIMQENQLKSIEMRQVKENEMKEAVAAEERRKQELLFNYSLYANYTDPKKIVDDSDGKIDFKTAVNIAEVNQMRINAIEEAHIMNETTTEQQKQNYLDYRSYDPVAADTKWKEKQAALREAKRELIAKKALEAIQAKQETPSGVSGMELDPVAEKEEVRSQELQDDAELRTAVSLSKSTMSVRSKSTTSDYSTYLSDKLDALRLEAEKPYYTARARATGSATKVASTRSSAKAGQGVPLIRLKRT